MTKQVIYTDLVERVDRTNRLLANEIRTAFQNLDDDRSRCIFALEEIARGEGEFSHDRLVHAINVIQSMKSIALKALGKKET